MRPHTFALTALLLLGTARAVLGQALPSGSLSGGGDIGLTYHMVRTNTLGQCGCFDLNGVGLSGSWFLRPPLGVVAEVSLDHTPQGPSGSSLTLSSYLAGARWLLRQPFPESRFNPQPFAQLLAGVGHAGGGVAGPGDKSNSLVARIGGGMDLPVSQRFSIRLIQVDYDLTTFGNGANNHQNNLLFGAGINYQWAR